MADTYIDQFETLVYGKFACEEMHNICLGKEPKLDGMVHFAIATQRAADKEMKSVIDRQPRPEAPLNTAAVLEEARDTIVRFASHLDSHKGRPFDMRLFFQNEAPSVLARRRMTKLTAAVGKILDEVERHKDKIREVDVWRGDLTDAHTKLLIVEKHQRATRVEKLDLAPDVAAARLEWLATYNANKYLIRGLLSHLGKVELMHLVFDDLAEVHRVTGVSDEAPTGDPGQASDTAPAPAHNDA